MANLHAICIVMYQSMKFIECWQYISIFSQKKLQCRRCWATVDWQSAAAAAVAVVVNRSTFVRSELRGEVQADVTN